MSYKNIELSPTTRFNTFPVKNSQFYTGYSSVNYDVLGTTSLYDFNLIQQDFLNYFNTRQGERLMFPNYGTIIWSLLFEPFTDDVKQAIIDDVKRILSSDPRAYPTDINIVEKDYGILLEASLYIKNTNQTTNMTLGFNSTLGYVTVQ